MSAGESIIIPLGAVGLFNAMMLAWAAAAIIPILLHFLNRRRQRPVPWAAMQILLQVIQREAKRMRIEQLLLLALRVMILLTLALAFARPYIVRSDAGRAAATRRPAKLWIVALDTSYSMGYRSGGRSRFEAARERAVDVLESAEQGDAYALIAMGKPARALVGMPTFDRAGLVSELQRMSVQDTGADVAASLALVADIAQAAKDDERLPQSIHILLLSDMGRDSWQSVVEGAERDKLQRLQEQYVVEVESFADESVANVAILGLQPSTNRAIAGNSLNVDVTVQSSGSAIERLPVQLALDGQNVASDFVDLPAGTARVVRLQVTPRATGQSVLTASVPDDQLAADNSRNHIIEVRDQYRILIVENEPQDARLLKLALQPAKGPALAPGISSRSKLEIGAIDLSEWDVVIVNDVASINAQVAKKLERFVRESGSLIFLFGANTVAEGWSAASATSDGSLLGFELLEPTPVSDWAIDPLDYRSPIVMPFAGFPDSGLLTTPIFRLWRAQASDPQQLVVDLATTDGAPLIVRHRVGQGWVASVLSAPEDGLRRNGTEPWNAIASWPSFLPLMQQLVQTVLNAGVEQNNVLAGEALQGKTGGAISRTQVTVVRPDGSESLLTTEAMDQAGNLPWVYGQTESRGIYRAQVADGREQLFAVNINPVESALESFAVAQLPKPSSARPVSGNVVGAQPSVETNDSLARLLLGMLFVLLLSESLFAWWIGRRVG